MVQSEEEINAYAEGQLAFAVDMTPMSANPYRPRNLRRAWYLGWLEKMFWISGNHLPSEVHKLFRTQTAIYNRIKQFS